MYSKAIIIFFINFCLGCQSNSQEFIVFQKDKIVPEVYISDTAYNSIALDFCDLFEKATGVKPHIVSTKPSGNNVLVIIGKDENLKIPDGFSIVQRKNTVSIAGTDEVNALYGVRYFFSRYADGNQFANDAKKSTTEILKIPSGLHYIKQYVFEYREPYFPNNQKKEFRLWNGTHNIDDSWALWGHNIHKFIQVNDQMKAVIDGRPNDEQYCFSSPELEEALTIAIREHSNENIKASKIMLMPNDNFRVCGCKRCEAIGNKKSNASPAVFTLLNKLALKFPKYQFFNTAYNTTISPPLFKLAANAGVMISTMPFPKGVVIEHSDKKVFIEKKLQEWKKITNTMYLWDYAVNFDNYFEAYPTVSIAQKNLQFYKGQGITGVFINGNEGSYSAFEDLKCYLYAQLLSDTDIDIEEHIALFFREKYPAVADILFGYYFGVEQRALNSGKPLEIYGGLHQARSKYLNDTDFTVFYNKLIYRYETLSQNESESLVPLLTALTFQKLEILRTNGTMEEGYACFDDKKTTATLNPEVAVLLERLTWLYIHAGLEVYNESGALVKEYIKSWEDEILSKKYENLFFNKSLKVLSVLDEGYSDAGVLNDGAVGFEDYYNNWLLSTKEELKLQIAVKDVKGATNVSLSFLGNTRHKIYLPKEVIITVGDKKFKSQKIKQKGDKYKYTAEIPIVIDPKDAYIIITVIKQDGYENMSTACDEIIFN